MIEHVPQIEYRGAVEELPDGVLRSSITERSTHPVDVSVENCVDLRRVALQVKTYADRGGRSKRWRTIVDPEETADTTSGLISASRSNSLTVSIAYTPSAVVVTQMMTKYSRRTGSSMSETHALDLRFDGVTESVERQFVEYTEDPLDVGIGVLTLLASPTSREPYPVEKWNDDLHGLAASLETAASKRSVVGWLLGK